MKRRLLALALGAVVLLGCGAPGEEAAPAATQAPAAIEEPAVTEAPAPVKTEEPTLEAEPPKPEDKIVQITLDEVRIPNGERTVYGKIYGPKTEGRHPAVILSHGYNGTNGDWVKECTLYAQNGFVACAIDFCGGSTRSKSSGKSTDMTITSEKEDLLAVFDYVRALENVDADKVVLFGGSQGGLVSALAAAERPEQVRALGLYFPAFCVPDDWKKKYNTPADAPESFDFWGLQLGRGFVEDVFGLDVFGTIGAYEGPVLILHGTNDAIVPFTYSEDAVDEVYETAELMLLPGEGHGFSPKGAQTAMETILHFLNDTCR